jgi:hypothetical protein
MTRKEQPMERTIWVRFGAWEFRLADVIAIEHRGDGSLLAHLDGGIKVPMSEDMAASFLADFDGTRTLRIPAEPPDARADDA